MEPFAAAQNDLFIRLSTRRSLISNGIHVQAMMPGTDLEAEAIISKLNNALAGQTSDSARAGLAVLIPQPGFENKQPNIPGLFGDMTFTVIVLENVMINRGDAGTGVTCAEAATMVMLAGADFPILDGRPLICDGMTPLEVDQQDFQADLAYEVRFRCKAGFNAELEVAALGATVDEDEVTFTCATSGAEIWVTKDGSMPHPGNPAAVIATGSFVITDERPVIVRACGYHPSLNPGKPAWLKLS